MCRNVNRNVVQTVHSRNKQQSVLLSMFRALSHTAPPCERTALVLFPHTLPYYCSLHYSFDLVSFFRFNSGISLDSRILLAPGARGGLSR